MSFKLSSLILKAFGWKVVDFPYDAPKFLIVVAPHTSNWDFPLGILAKNHIGAKMQYIAKDSLFRPPFGFFFRWLGGYPVDRSIRNNFVQTVIDVFNKEDEFITVIAPEGTRKKVEKLKTGFYYIAQGANIPLVLTRFDWEKKEVRFRELFYVTGDMEADMKVVDDYFRGIKGKNPEQGYLYEG